MSSAKQLLISAEKMIDKRKVWEAGMKELLFSEYINYLNKNKGGKK